MSLDDAMTKVVTKVLENHRGFGNKCSRSPKNSTITVQVKGLTFSPATYHNYSLLKIILIYNKHAGLRRNSWMPISNEFVSEL